MVNVCKLIFKISKDKSKDTLFKENKIISKLFLLFWYNFAHLTLFFLLIEIINARRFFQA